jgi:hypothetical protein
MLRLLSAAAIVTCGPAGPADANARGGIDTPASRRVDPGGAARPCPARNNLAARYLFGTTA